MAAFRNKIRLQKDSYIQTDFHEEHNANSLHKQTHNNTLSSKNVAYFWNNTNYHIKSSYPQCSSNTSTHYKQHLCSSSVISNYNNNIIGRNNSNISNYKSNSNNSNTNNSNRSVNKHLNCKSKISLSYRNCVSFTNSSSNNNTNESSSKHFQWKSFRPVYTKSNINIHNKPYIIDKKFSKNMLTPYKFRNIMKDMLKRSFSRQQHKQISLALKSKSNCLPELQIDNYVNPYKDMDINSEYKRKVIDDDVQLTLKDELKKAKDKVEFTRKYNSRNNKRKKRCS